MRLGGRRFGVVGGGVGGLAAALALQRHGAEVVVFERTRRRHQGIALLVWSNAMKALSSLGVAEAVLARATPIERTEVRTAHGALLADLPIGEWSKRAEMPSVSVFRRDLLAALTAPLGSDVVRDDVEIISFAPTRDRVEVRHADGTRDTFDALIGADGINSIIRTQMLGLDPPRALQQQAWVGWADVVTAPGVATATIGRGPRFWHAPLAGGTFWYATVNRVVGDRRDLLLEAVTGWHAPIVELIEATRDDRLISTQIRDRPPAAKWGEGLVTLLGDAAHASTPDLGQGACQALESATALGVSLARGETLEEGLRDYERARLQRTAAISRLSWMTSVNSTIESAMLCRLRDTAIRTGLRSVARGHLEWILAGQPC
jgi:2-polyprenyl-6-methoxyphenol hydroxylase-like FAD-dependent oxidoreductase